MSALQRNSSNVEICVARGINIAEEEKSDCGQALKEVDLLLLPRRRAGIRGFAGLFQSIGRSVKGTALSGFLGWSSAEFRGRDFGQSLLRQLWALIGRMQLMARCKHCEKGGIFQKVDKEGLCKSCAPTVTPDIDKHSNVIYEAMHLHERGQSYEEKLAALDDILASAHHLQQYEAKGISSCNPPPSLVAAEYAGFREELVKQHE